MTRDEWFVLAVVRAKAVEAAYAQLRYALGSDHSHDCDGVLAAVASLRDAASNLVSELGEPPA